MKKLIVLIVVAITVSSCTPYENVIVPSKTVERIVEIEGKSQDDLFLASNLWFTDAFHSSKTVITFSDSALGVIKANFTLKSSLVIEDGATFYQILPNKIKGSMLILVKDNALKVKITSSDFSSNVFEGISGNYTSVNVTNDMNSLIQSLVTSVNSDKAILDF